MGASTSKVEHEDGSHDVWTVLPHHMGGGPCGLGTFPSCVTTPITRNTLDSMRKWAWLV